jgi:DNA-binding CsgD family transcriptional regulator
MGVCANRGPPVTVLPLVVRLCKVPSRPRVDVGATGAQHAAAVNGKGNIKRRAVGPTRRTTATTATSGGGYRCCYQPIASRQPQRDRTITCDANVTAPRPDGRGAGGARRPRTTAQRRRQKRQQGACHENGPAGGPTGPSGLRGRLARRCVRQPGHTSPVHARSRRTRVEVPTVIVVLMVCATRRLSVEQRQQEGTPDSSNVGPIPALPRHMRRSGRRNDPPRDPWAPDPARRRLSDREQEIALLVADGLKDIVIARRLGLSISTVRTYIRGIRVRLALDSRAELVAWVAARRRPSSGEGPLHRISDTDTCDGDRRREGLSSDGKIRGHA